MRNNRGNLAFDWSAGVSGPTQYLETQVITLRIVREQIGEALVSVCQATWQAFLESTPKVLGVDAVLFEIAPAHVRVDGARQCFWFYRGQLACVARVRSGPPGDEVDRVVHATVAGTGQYEVATPGRLRLAEVRLRARLEAEPR